MKPAIIEAHAESGRLWVPEVEYREIPDGHTTCALRGHAYVVAVLDASGACVGWADRILLRDKP